MRRVRVIPVLLLNGRKLIKTKKFSSPKYVGDPINALKIFNEKEVDEVVVLDTAAARRGAPDFEYISQLVSECFMPLAYGGGITNFEQAGQLISIGVEKIVLGAGAFQLPELITRISTQYGAQSAVVCIDVKKNIFSQSRVYIKNGNKNTGLSPVEFATRVQELGAGEIILQSVERDGTQMGYDLELLKKVCDLLEIPVVALGGAGKIEDFKAAVTEGKASAVAAGSMFVFQGPHRAILISYPEYKRLNEILG